jgi:hypothetical protein
MSWKRRRAQNRADRLERENIRRYHNSPMPTLLQTFADAVEEAGQWTDAVIRLENALRTVR